ncbi:protein ALP1-like [Thalassophryne amazonica]|uniref:protein ALP1-like n=1 Tax=Thalassophryne amazonica TaxID=390379 RepID=UPI001470F279|nr:protein ALP1-like [Thalassophryne amazonica]
MEPVMFHEILQRLTPRIEKQDTFRRKALEPGVKLAITIRFLATGDSYKSLMYNFRVHASTICKFIQPVCEAIIDEYSSELVSCPKSPEAWLQVAQGFESRWNLPHCIGAIDGKHIAMKCPKNSGSLFYNYKEFHSIVLMALVDADYKFLSLHVGASGSGLDGGIFEGTALKRCMEDGSIGLPSPLPGGDRPVGYYIVGDDAFPLKTWLMKPVPSRKFTIEDRIYNYRLSRAWRVVENAFGLLSSR